MAIESGRDSVDANYEAQRHAERQAAIGHLYKAAYCLDNALRGTKDAVGRTLISITHDLAKQAEDMINVVDQLDPAPEVPQPEIIPLEQKALAQLYANNAMELLTRVDAVVTAYEGLKGPYPEPGGDPDYSLRLSKLYAACHNLKELRKTEEDV
jgi:hypothetical protein